jgi:hypothetical protein
MNEKRRIPWKRCITNAIRDLKIGGTDCLNLVQIMLEEANVSLPLVQVMQERWKFWRQNKQHQLVADQVQSMSSQCVKYLELRMREACRETEPPPNPWNVLADYVEAPQSEELRAAADKVRGVLETIAGVVAPDPPDLEAMKLVGQIIFQFLSEAGLQCKKLLYQTLTILSTGDTVMSSIDEFYGILRDVAKCLEQGQPNKIKGGLVTAGQILDLAAKTVQHTLRDVVLTKR